MTPLSDAAISAWPAYADAVQQRLVAGCATYGDASFTAPVERLCAEIKSECLDLAGWGYVLWLKVDDMERRWKSEERGMRLGISDIVMEQVLQQRTDDDK